MQNCQICGSEMKLIPAGTSKKTGKPYQSFMACPNKCKSPINNTRPEKPQYSNEHVELMNFIGEQFANINKRMDGQARYLKSWREGTTEDVNVKDIQF